MNFRICHILLTVNMSQKLLKAMLELLKSMLKPNTSIIFEPVHEISNNVVYATSKSSDQPALTRSLIRAYASRLSIL